MAAITSATTNSNLTLSAASQLLRPTNSVTTDLLQSTNSAAEPNTKQADPARDFIRVSSSIGRAASAGQLSRQEALDIYRQIASLL